MDFLDFENVKAEKEIDMFTYIRLRSLTKLFRFLELCFALLLLLWTFNRLPFAVRISGEFLRWIAGVIASPLFVFALGNAIIAILIVKSGRFSGDNPGADIAETELYEELIKNSGNPKSSSENPPHATTEEIVFQDKEIITSQANDVTRACESLDDVSEHDPDSSDSELDTPRVYRRTKSAKMERESAADKVKAKLLLRRSETEKCRKMAEADGENLWPEDEMSEEEFQRAIDEFIAKNLMFRRKESQAFVRQIQS